MGKYAVARIYGEGKRPGSTLASTLHPRHKDNALLQIQDNDVWNDATSMVEMFHDYHTGLHKSRSQFDEAAVMDYLIHIAMSRLTDEQRVHSMGPLRPEEIRVALADMLTGKVSGIEGLTVAFYKAYQNLLMPHLVTLFEEMAAGGCRLPTVYEALLIVLFKPEKPADCCSSYRRLYLMKVDAKLYAKILATQKMMNGVLKLF
ncbi:hypothetical protein NDU88_000021 [Pleurodeles waltl]|uniref:Uncharacterized protein n=1 Tax=Pleurodeles waltl TaxID=8319 RepID=A0AAV7N898_PLEWA|nr:hypothetical protein NDU88_000021 [Pleurodeles waltl]